MTHFHKYALSSSAAPSLCGHWHGAASPAARCDDLHYNSTGGWFIGLISVAILAAVSHLWRGSSLGVQTICSGITEFLLTRHALNSLIIAVRNSTSSVSFSM